MTTEDNSDPTELSVARVEAARWSARLHSGNMSDQERSELVTWRQANLHNEREFQAIEQLGQRTAALPKSLVQALYGGRIPERPDRRRRRVLRTGLALACTTGVAVGVGLMVRLQEQAGYTSQLATRKGERRSIKLPDGSVLELNTGTTAKIAFYADIRRVELLQGEIMFTVAADAHKPFVIDAGEGEIRVTGTSFNVRRDPSRVSVAVESGSVDVLWGRWWSRRAQRLMAGQGTSFDQTDALAATSKVDVAAATAWRNGRLVFKNASVSEVIHEMNRYLEQPIRLTDTSVQRLRVTASFLLDDPGALVSSLQQVVPVDVRYLADGSMALVARQP